VCKLANGLNLKVGFRFVVPAARRGKAGVVVRRGVVIINQSMVVVYTAARAYIRRGGSVSSL